MAKIQEIAAQLDDAVAVRDDAKLAVEKAEAVLKAANEKYTKAVSQIRALDAAYQSAIKSILSYGGANHVE